MEELPVYPVSARQALQAKLAASLEDGTVDTARLSEDPLWTTSGFKELEEFIFGFMGASTDKGAERLRLKLETPLGVGLALLTACESQLTAEAFKAEGDLKALEDVQKQLQRFEEAMLNGAILQRQRTLAVVSAPSLSNASIFQTLSVFTSLSLCSYILLFTYQRMNLKLSISAIRTIVHALFCTVLLKFCQYSYI